MSDRRFNRGVTAVVLVVSLVAISGWSTEVSGSLTFDGLSVAEVFPGMVFGGVSAYNVDTAERVVGTVNAAQSTYSIDLVEGTYNFALVLGEEQDTDWSSHLPGNLWGNQSNIMVGSSGSETLDFPLYYMVHVTAPYANDNNGASWGGSVLECPYGPEVSTRFRLEWDPVPRVNRYSVTFSYFECPDWVKTETVETTEPSVDVEINSTEAETLSFYIGGFGESGPSVTAMPYMIYDNGSTGTTGHWLHGVEGSGRPVHSSNSSFLIQVARLAGVGSSYWTSDVTLSNTGPASVLATLTFTPRGAEGLIDFTSRTYEIPAYSCRTIKDVVGTLFGLTEAGSLEISPSTIRAFARTATPGDAGTYGQFFPAVPVDGDGWASLSGGKVIRAAGVVRGAFRTNLILAELWGEEAVAQVRLIDRDGLELGVRSYPLPALGNIQVNNVVRVVTGDANLQVEDAQVVVSVTSGAGRVAGALSIVDQGTDDPMTVMLD